MKQTTRSFIPWAFIKYIQLITFSRAHQKNSHARHVHNPSKSEETTRLRNNIYLCSHISHKTLSLPSYLKARKKFGKINKLLNNADTHIHTKEITRENCRPKRSTYAPVSTRAVAEARRGAVPRGGKSSPNKNTSNHWCAQNPLSLSLYLYGQSICVRRSSGSS